MKKVILIASMFMFITAVKAQDSKATPAATPAVKTQDKAVPVTATPAAPENKNAPEFKFEVDEYNFGTIKQGEKVTYDFKFVNTGKEPLIISEAHGSCGCTVPQWPKEPVAKGASGMIHVEFNSTGKMGMQDKTVTITSNAKEGSKILHLKGNVEAPPPATTTTPEEKK